MSEIVNEVECRTKILVETCNFKWSIENFSVICSIKTKEKKFLISPTFTIGETSSTKWCALMNFHEDVNFINIYLERSSSNICTHHVSYKVSIIGSDTTKYLAYDTGNGHLYDKNTPMWGYTKSIQRKILFEENSLLLLPNNTLTVMFELKVSAEENIDEATYLAVPIVLKETDSLVGDMKHLYENKMFSDFTLKVGNEELKVHKLILCARSTVFNSMLTTDMKESITHCLEITDFDPHVVKAMLQYIYCGQVEEIIPDLGIQLYSIADKYNLQDLKNICVKFLLKNLNVSNICDVLVLCDMHNEPELMMAAKKMFCANAAAVQETEKWIDLSKKMPDLSIAMYRFAISQK
ncbi:hypothetical protein JTE90_002136 [Oedothorax gibbosus]|uniref:Speckle-type POZ protein n=1 Tax=Oedothorax gibbosus TaxID=931172 RepID=A0AAV6V6F3_9ARAC|nr:hypothetical protein JTE90_002136 [Oedothorax gibbosus]